MKETWEELMKRAREQAAIRSKRMSVTGWRSSNGAWHYAVISSDGKVRAQMLEERQR